MKPTKRCLFILLILFCLSPFAEEVIPRSRDFQISKEEKTKELQSAARLRMLVFEGLAQDLPWSLISLGNAGIIFQHTNTESEPDEGEEYRSQEMHLLTYFLMREKAQLNNEPEHELFGPYRYRRVMQLPVELDIIWKEDPITKVQTIASDSISDEERMKCGFPFPLIESYSRANTNPLPNKLRVSSRDEEINQLYLADQQTRSLFKKTR